MPAVSFNKNISFDDKGKQEILVALNYAIRNDFDFGLVVNAYTAINVINDISERKIGGFFDAEGTGGVENYFKITFYNPDIGQSSNYHIYSW